MGRIQKQGSLPGKQPYSGQFAERIDRSHRIQYNLNIK